MAEELKPASEGKDQEKKEIVNTETKKQKVTNYNWSLRMSRTAREMKDKFEELNLSILGKGAW